MPRLSCWFIRSSLGYLVLGYTAGALILSHKGSSWLAASWRLLPLHVEFVLIGWTVQLAMGVAFWILPRLADGAGRGDEAPAWWAFVLLNAGVLLVGAASALGASSAWSLGGRLAEAGAAVSFAVHAWPRVRGLATPL